MPAPEDAAAAVTLTLHVLRELRGGAHLAAVVGSGMHPAEAALAAPPPRGGPGWAADLGWPEPLPDMAVASTHRSQAEVQTSALCVSAFENGLSPAERFEFATLVVEARAAIG